MTQLASFDGMADTAPARVSCVGPLKKSDAFVFFGATGDLAFKEIFPALFELFCQGGLMLPILGVARSELTREQFHDRARRSLIAYGTFQHEPFQKFIKQLSYLSGDYCDQTTYVQLEQHLEGFERPLFYMAVPPEIFEAVVHGIARVRCGPRARLVIEKPFGRDLASSQALNDLLTECFPESSLFRVDHFLAKNTVENLVFFRFANVFVEPVWSRHYIKSIQITLSENFGIAGRGAFYDNVGAVRDVVQNHLFQVLSLLAIEPPACLTDPVALSDAQLQVFRSIEPVTPGQVRFGQFDGYHSEAGVRINSNTETFVAMRLAVKNDRWMNVPFYIRAGKRLPVTCTEVLVNLKPTGRIPSHGQSCHDLTRGGNNYFRFRLDPDMRIALGAQIKEPGKGMTGHDVELLAQYDTQVPASPYVRVLGDAIHGDSTFFARFETIQESWRIVQDILQHAAPVDIYQPGTWGPECSSDVLINQDRWRTPVTG